MISNIFIAVLLTACVNALAATETPAADNSAVNERDRSITEVTAEDQGTSEKDVGLTRRIRQEVVKNDKLSTDAHNIKIITINGKVTLKGPVQSLEEKNQLERISKKLAGNANVRSEIEIVTN